jgi:LacI family transcriptional regulator
MGSRRRYRGRLGISLITVSRALNDSGYVSEELKKRILDYAKERSFVPTSSQALVRNRTRSNAVFSSSPADLCFGTYQERDRNRRGTDSSPFNYTVRYHMIPEYDSEAYLGRLKKEQKGGWTDAPSSTSVITT